MRDSGKIFAAPTPVRKSVAAQRMPAAWIDSGEGISFSALVTPRVRDGLVLRPVEITGSGRGRSHPDAHRCR
jgi:hypothetical protein